MSKHFCFFFLFLFFLEKLKEEKLEGKTGAVQSLQSECIIQVEDLYDLRDN